MKKLTRNHLLTTQEGAASIVIAMVMIIVISLLVLGFAQISRREQRLALDRQLSTQAFYAAESGINDALNAIKTANYLNILGPGGKTTCATAGASDPLNNPLGPAFYGTISGNGGAQYTCLLINPAPQSLQFSLDPFDPNREAQVVPLNSVNSAGGAQSLDSVTFKWSQNPVSASSNFGSCPFPGIFPTVWPSNCPTGILRVDLVAGNTLDRASLNSKTQTIFIVPATSVLGQVAFNPNILLPGNTQGKIVFANCIPASLSCSATVNMGPGAANTYYARVKAVYSTASVTITGQHGFGSTNLKGFQALIDSTGRAQDVLRRLEVHVPLNTQVGFPNYAIESNSTICKHMGINPLAAPQFTLDNDLGIPVPGECTP